MSWNTRVARARRNGPRLCLGVFCLCLLVVALTRNGISFESVDVRQYAEMVKGVGLHGVPQIDNGPVERFVALRVPWNVFVNGRLWGTYAPLYSYFAAPLFAVSWRLVWIATFALLIPLALVSFDLARRVIGDEWYALVAAVGAVASTPVLGKAFETTGYPLLVLFATAGALASVVAIESQGRRRLVASACVGALFALGSASHLLCFPLGAASVGLLAFADARAPDETRGPAWLSRTPFRGFWPTRETLASSAVAFAMLIVFLAPVAWLNHVRFGTYNPLSYGPTPWRGVLKDMTIGGHLRYAAPTLALALSAAAAWVFAGTLRDGSRGARRRGTWLIRSVALAVVALVLWRLPEVRERTWQLGRMAIIVIVDGSVLDLDPPYHRIPGAFGNLVGPWVLKSTLQATPVLALAFVPPRGNAAAKHKMAALLFPVFAFYTYLTMRANLPVTPAIGWAWVSMRYTLPALPILFVAALAVVKELSPSRSQWILGFVVALGLVFFLARRPVDDGDDAFVRHVLILAVPVGLGALAIVLTLLCRRGLVKRPLAATAVMVLLAWGFGIGMGHDLPSHLSRRAFSDWKVASVADNLPQRFAVFGIYWAMDQMLGLRMSRDVEYGDLSIIDNDLPQMRALIDYWFEQDRPIYRIGFPEEPPLTSPWPDLEYQAVDADQRLYRVVRRVAPSPPPN